MNKNSKKTVIEEAADELRKLKGIAFQTAKATLAESLAPTISAAVAEASDEVIGEELGGGGDPPANYDEDGEQKRVDDNLPAVGDSGDDLSDEGDGPAVVEAGLEEDDIEVDDIDDDDDDFDIGDEGGEEIDMDYEEGDDDDDVIEVVEDDDMDTDLDDEGGEEMDIDTDVEEEPMEAPMEEPEEDLEVAYESKKLARENRKLKREASVLKRNVRKLSRTLSNVTEKMEEVNLFNARLQGATKVINKNSLTREEKEKVIDAFDDCESINEVKRTYKVLNETLKGSTPRRKRSANKNVNSVKSSLNEGNTEMQRMQTLAGVLEG